MLHSLVVVARRSSGIFMQAGASAAAASNLHVLVTRTGRKEGFTSDEECVEAAGDGIRITQQGRKKKKDGVVKGEGVGALENLVHRGDYVPLALWYWVLKSCAGGEKGVRGIRGLVVGNGYGCSEFLASHVIREFARCGRLEEARQVFDRMVAPNSYLWSAIIYANAEHGDAAEAIKLYRRMRESGEVGDSHVLVAVLKACGRRGDLKAGREVHADVFRAFVESDGFVESCLVDMYVKCGSLGDARMVFDGLEVRNVVTWNAMLAGYVLHGLGEEVLALYGRMEEEMGRKADGFTFACLLKACGSTGELGLGREVHVRALESGVEGDVVLGSCLVDMYVKCGRLGDARRVLDGMGRRDVVIWTAMLAGYAEHGLGQEALALYAEMEDEGLAAADHVMFVCLLRACGCIGALEQGRLMHARVEEQGWGDDVVVGSCLVDMYSKCGSLDDACWVFERLPMKDVVTWTAMVVAYVERGFPQEALALYASMLQESITSADSVAFASLLKACGSLRALEQGRQLHKQLQVKGLAGDPILGSCLVDMYTKCGCVDEASRVFDNLTTKTVVTWTSMISGYADLGLVQESLTLYARMQEERLTPVDSGTFARLLKACASTGALDQGKQLHLQIEEQFFEMDVLVGSCLVYMYAKCGSLIEARRVFDSLSKKDVVTWTVMLVGYVEQGLGQEALALYASMNQEGIIPADSVTFASVLKACGSIGALDQGKQLHAQIREKGLEADMVIGSCLVDLYAKCGSLNDASKMFNSLAMKDVVTWNAMLTGYGQHGLGQEAVQCFESMQLAGIPPNGITFLSLISACSHAGLVDKGLEYFESMTRDHGLHPDIDHYVTMIDLLGRAGYFTMIENLLSSMPLHPNLSMWMCLLAACRKHSNIVLAQRAFLGAVSLEPKHSAAYVLMSQIYAAAGLLDKANMVESWRKREGAWKEPGRTWVQVHEEAHTFLVGDASHPDHEQLCDLLQNLSLKLRKGASLPT